MHFVDNIISIEVLIKKINFELAQKVSFGIKEFLIESQ